MAVLGRLKVAPNQRLDLPDIVAFDAYSAGDWKGFLEAMVDDKPYLIKGFEVFQPNTLIGNPAGSVDIVVNGSSLWWSAGSEGSFFVSLPGSENKSVTLITDATNYIEMSLTLSSRAEDARALWDPGANGGNGGEFTQVVDTENFLDVTVSRNNTGFSEDKIAIAKIVVNASNNVLSITDCRPMLFRLGTGGNTPDPLNDYIWRDDPAGFSRTDSPTTMSSPSDPNVFRGADKNIRSMKEWMDAIMSRIKEIDGGSKWFQATGGGGGGSGGALSLTNLFLDSQAGHSPIPDRKVTLTWSKLSDNKLRSENAVGYSQPVRWGANFGQLRWQVGGTFVSGANRAYSDYTFEVSVADGENLYLQLQRDAALNGDPIVHFENLGGVTGFASAFAAGSFTGVACGDYVRKESNNVYQYYRVAEIRVNAGTPFTNGTVEGTVADATVQYLLLETHDGPISTTDEPYRFFRKSYDENDFFSSDIGTIDTSAYWIGRRIGTMFYLRDYGDMQPGEETEVLNDHDGNGGAGVADLTFDRSYDSVYDPTNGYSLKAGGTTTLLTIRRRLADNTVGTPSGVDNSSSLLTYTINAPIGLMNDNDTLWVRLGLASGALAGGDVTDVSTDNVWEVRDPSDAPLRTYDNKNVYLVARKFTINSVATLLFSDGTMLSLDGQRINNHLAIQGDLFLKQFAQWSIPFISTTTGKLDVDAQFLWTDNAGPDSLGQFRARNLTLSRDNTNGFDLISQVSPSNIQILPSIGARTIQVGGSTATVYIPGDLLVDGTTTSINTSNLQIDDKLITVGVGALSNGAYGAGLEAADDTRSATQIASTNTQVYVDITYGAAHPYVLGSVVGVDSNSAVGGITAGQLSGPYTVVTTGSLAGDAQVMSATVLRVWTSGTATSTASVSLSPPTTEVRTYTAPWSIRIGDSASNYTSADFTSWVFRIKGVATAPTLTPVANYGIVPTAHSVNMQSGRIPFVNNDNVGPSGADTTLDFSAALTWNGAALVTTGNLLPSVDDTYDVGSTTLRWNGFHAGTEGVIVHGDATNTLKATLSYTGSIATLGTDAASNLQLRTGTGNGLRIDTAGRGSFGEINPNPSIVFYVGGQTTSLATGSGQTSIRVGSTLAGISTNSGLKVGYSIQAGTAAAEAIGVEIEDTTPNAGATIGSQYSIRLNELASGTTANYGLFSSITAGTGKWFLYGAGAASNYLSGSLGLGNSTQAAINTQRLLLGSSADTTVAGGMNFGTDIPLFRSAATTLSLGAHFLPQTDNTWSLGSATFRWANIFATSIALTGSLQVNVSTVKTSNYTMSTSDCLVRYNTTGGAFTITLPASTAGNTGRVIILKDVGGFVGQVGKALTLAPNGSNTIDGVNANIVINFAPFTSLTLIADGAGGWTLN